MDIWNGLILGFAIALTPENLAYALIGCLVGTLVGVLPGIGSAGGMVILLPLTFQLPATGAIIMLAAIFYGSYYGGTISTVLMRVPGEAASVVTLLDGAEMASRGRAGAALTIAALGSFIGGTVAVAALVLLAPLLTDIALRFGPAEFFALLACGLATLVLLAGDSMLKALVMALFGLLLGTIGTDPTLGTPRFDFGLTPLLGGLDFVPVVMGLFGLGELLLAAGQPTSEVIRPTLKGLYPTGQELRASGGPFWRGTLLGIVLGLIPGTTQALASFISYGVEKGVARHPETFGKGAVQGLAGPETANNAHANAALIPLFTLGIPGSPSVAILLGAFVLNGLAPGPLLFSERPEVVWPIIASMVIGNLMLLLLNVPFVGLWVRVLQVPARVLQPLIVVFICLGTYLTNNSAFDVWVMIIFGALGATLRRYGFPLTPIALTIIVGPLMEQSLRQVLTISGGELGIFLARPIALALLVLAALVLTVPLWRRRDGALLRIRSTGAQEE